MYEVFPVPLGQFTSMTYPRLSEANGRETPHISAWTTWPETFWPRSKMRCLAIHCNSLKQANRGALAAGGGEKEGELSTTSLEFEYLHRKSRCEMLIGGHDISNDLITPWHVFFNVSLHSRSFPLRADWRKFDNSVDGEPQCNWRWNSNSTDVVASSPSFSRPAARAPWELAPRLSYNSATGIPGVPPRGSEQFMDG